MLVTPPCGASSNIALWRAKIKPPVELVVGDLNNWLHKYVYKRKYDDLIGCTLRKEYESGRIRTENEFKEVLERVLSDRKKN